MENDSNSSAFALAVNDSKPDGERIKSHGVDFHERQLLLYILTCLDVGHKFQMTCEIDIAGKFDDIVLKYDKQGKSVCRLIQVKHKDVSKKTDKIDEKNLFKDGPYDLRSYFKSYKEKIIEGNFETVTKCEVEDVVILSNIGFADSVERRMEEVKHESFENETLHRLKIEQTNEDFVDKLATKSHAPNPVSDEDKVHVRAFINKLRFGVCRPDGKLLDRIIKDKIKKCLSKLKLFVEDHDFTYDILMSRISQFHTRPEIQLVDTDICNGWLVDAGENCKKLLSKVHIANVNRLKIHKLSFRRNSLSKMEPCDDGGTVQFLKSHTDIDITLLKLTAVFKERGNSFYLVTDQQLMHSKPSIEGDVQSAKVDYLVVQLESMSEFLDKINNLSTRMHVKKLIVVLDSVNDIRHDFPHMEDSTELEDFDAESRESLGRKMITFQGQKIEFSHIDISRVASHVKDGVLSDLFRGRLEVSKRFVDAKTEEMAYFVERTVGLRGKVNPMLFKRDDEKFLFAVSNVDDDRFRQIVDGLRTDILLSVDDRFVRLSSENMEDEFDSLCRTHREKTVLWLFVYDDEFYFKKSSRTIDKNDYINTSVERIDVSRLANIEGHVLMIGEPGMGKSNLFSKLAQRSIEENPDVWVIKINLDDYSSYFLGMKGKSCTFSDIDSVVDFLIHTQSFKNQFEKYLFRSYFESEQKLIVLCDGFDEIAPSYRDVVTSLLQYLKNVPGIRLWISSRPQERDHLERRLVLLPFYLIEFTPDDQKEFFFRFWNARNTIEEAKLEHSTLFIDRLIKIAGESLCAADTLLTGIPLQCRMLAVMYEDRFKEFYQSDSHDTSLQNTLDVLDMYKEFVGETVIRYIVEKRRIDTKTSSNEDVIDDEKEKCIEKHKLLALSVIFAEAIDSLLTVKEKRRIEQYKVKILDGKEKTGLVHSIKNGDPVFIHRTFAEYFSALWFFDRFREDRSEADTKVVEAFTDIVFRPEHEVVRKFFDRLAAKSTIHKYVLNNDSMNLEILLDEDDSRVRELDEFGRTPLHLTVAYNVSIVGYTRDRKDEDDSNEDSSDDEDSGKDNHDSIMTLLIEKEADTTVVDRLLRWKPIRYQYAASRNWRNIERLLVGNENDATLDFIKNGFEDALTGGHAGIVRYCLKHYKTDVRALWRDAPFKLHKASEKGHAELCELLVEYGSEVNSRDSEGKTPLHYACKEINDNVYIRLIRHGANIHEVNKTVLLKYAFYRGEVDIIEELIRIESIELNLSKLTTEWLHAAIRSKEVDAIELLIEYGADVDGEDGYSRTPLHTAVIESTVGIVGLLLDSGADVEATDCKGQTPLMYAVKKRNNLTVIKLLCKKGADVSRCDEHGQNILHHVATQGSIKTLKYLLSLDLNLDEGDKYGFTPLHLVTRRGDLGMIKCLVDSGANVHVTDRESRSTLYHAASCGPLEIVEYLIMVCVDTDAADKDGLTPLQLAAKRGQVGMFKCLVRSGQGCSTAGYNRVSETSEKSPISAGNKRTMCTLLDGTVSTWVN